MHYLKIFEGEVVMKKRTLATLFILLILIASLFSCGTKNATDPSTKRMTVDINPSVEFMIGTDGKVVSVTAENDDGAILIVGEAFIGKTPEEAVELMVTIAAETGYLVKGNAEKETNTVKISVSGDDEYTKKIMDNVNTAASAVLAELDINGAIEKVDALTTEALRALVIETSLYTEIEVEAMTEEQMYEALAESRIETAQLLTEDMRTAYYSAKEYEISFAESEETAKIIQSLGGLYTITYTAYKTALDTYSSAITQLDDLRYNLLVSPESEYQKSLVALREAKLDFLKQRTYTAALDINGTEYATATVNLQVSEENYDKALAAYEALGEQANATIESLIATLKQAESSLIALEDTLFDQNIEEALAERASELEAKLNMAKDAFFEEFEAAHEDDIAAIEDALLAQKEALKTGDEAES